MLTLDVKILSVAMSEQTPTMAHAAVRGHAHIPAYPWIDTFFALAILLAVPRPLGAVALAVYVLGANPDVLDAVLGAALGAVGPSEGGDACGVHGAQGGALRSVGLAALARTMLLLVTDALCTLALEALLPASIPYIVTFATALLAAALGSTRVRSLLDAVSTVCATLLLEYASGVAQSLLRHDPRHTVRDVRLVPRNDWRFTPTLGGALNLLHASLALYVIIHNINPLLREWGVLSALTLRETPEVLSTAHPPTCPPALCSDCSPPHPLHTVSLNLRHYARALWTPRETLDQAISAGIAPISSPSSGAAGVAGLLTPKGSSKVAVRKPKPSPNPLARYYPQRYLQPLWALVEATRAMLTHTDYYSGDYYSHNALTTNGYYLNEKRPLVASPQCFVWYVGETCVGFELHGISLEQLLIKVNGIIWSHVSSCRVKSRELVFVNGLSPLFQYDVEFVKITINGDLIHLSTNTVSTVFKDRHLALGNVQSPITTMQNSILTTRDSIEREKARLRKLKSEFRKRCGHLKSQIQSLNSRMAPADESRNYKKLENLRSTIGQTDTALASLSTLLEEVTAEQTALEEVHHQQKRALENQTHLHATATRDFHAPIDTLAGQAQNLRSERDQLNNKIDKTLKKKTKVQSEVRALEEWIQNVKLDLINSQTRKRQELALLKKGDINQKS